MRGHPTEGDDCAIIKFVDPHFVREESKQSWLRVFEWIDLSRPITFWCTSVAIHPDPEPDTGTNEHERDKEHRLNQAHEFELRRFAREIRMQPWPCGREKHAEENRADREHDQRRRHYSRAFVDALGCRA